MQILSMRPLALVAFVAVLALSGASFTPKHAARKSAAPKMAGSSQKVNQYYWFDPSDNQYLDYTTVEEEEYIDWEYFDAPVDDDPAGGMLIDEGFFDHSYPHDEPALVYLYVHF